MQPSEKYAVDYTDSKGLKWSKRLSQIYTTLGNIDMSAAISSFNDPLVKNIYRKSSTYNPVYDNSITYASVGHDSLVMKYFSRNDYPSESMISGTAILGISPPDGSSYATGVNEDASVPYDGGFGSARVLVDAEYNKMLFQVILREMTLNTSNVPIQKDLYDDPTYTDVELKDIDDNKWYGLFYHDGAKVWNGSSWEYSYIGPALMCNGSSVQSFQGGGSAFNNLFNNYNDTMGTGQNIAFTNAASNYYWTAHNFVNKMNIENYSLGWSDTYDYKPSFADNFDAMKTFMLNYLIDNGYSPFQTVNFQLCREVHKISDDMSVLLTIMCSAQLDNNRDLYIRWNSVYTFPIIKGSSVSKFLAGYGLYYLADRNADLTGITPDTLHNSSNIWVGEMSANGTTTGNWIKGADIENYAGYNKDGNIVNPDFDPSGGGGGGSTEDDYTDMDLGVSNITLGGLTKYAILSKSELIALIADYNGNAAMAGSNFSNHIICLYRLGFPASSIATTVTGNIVMVRSAGDVDFTSQANTYKLVTKQSVFIDAGGIKVPRMTNTFYDFSPYSSYELYIPSCGWIPLPDNVAGRSIHVYIVFDLPTCSAKGIVRIAGGIYGGTTIATVNGIIGASCPFTIGENGQQRAAVMSANAQVAAGIATGIVGATVNPMMAVAGGAELLSGLISSYTAGNTNYVSTKGGAADFSMFGDGGRAVLKINSPVIDSVVNNSYFGHTVGYMCNETGQLNSFHGFTVCSNPHVHISATSTEKEEIKRLLEEGVILP